MDASKFNKTYRDINLEENIQSSFDEMKTKFETYVEFKFDPLILRKTIY
jgi:hypothetical protein